MVPTPIKQFVPNYLGQNNIEEQTGYSNSPNNQSNMKDGPNGFEEHTNQYSQ